MNYKETEKDNSTTSGNPYMNKRRSFNKEIEIIKKEPTRNCGAEKLNE